MKILLALAAAFAGVLHAGAEATIPGNSPLLSYEGRTQAGDGGAVRLGYPGIVLRFHFRGTGLQLQVAASSAEVYLDCAVDGGEVRMLELPAGTSSLVLATGLPAGEHHVTVTKRVESSVGDLTVQSATAAGEWLPPAPLPERRLLFLGDSFVAGQATPVEDGGPMDPSKARRENARLCFARLLGDHFHAQVHLIAYAGRGVIRDWQGLRDVRLAPEFYENALPDDDRTRWQPGRYVPDAIGVCLGQNDFDTGIPDETEYVQRYAEFIRKLRHDAPDAVILLLSAPGLADEPGRSPRRTVQLAYLAEVARRLADPRVQVVPLDHFAGVPGDGHPSGTAHRAIARALAPVIAAALHWN